MKTRFGRLCTFTLISLLSFCGLAMQTAAQDNTLSQLADRPKSPATIESSQEAKSVAKPVYSVLYSFCSVLGQDSICADGSVPVAGLIQDAAGNLYGTTPTGGNGEGTVFKVDTTGSETVLYGFCSIFPSCADGEFPQAGLIQDTVGNLYGTTESGGANGYGTVFKVDPTGQETVLYSFCSVPNCTEGSAPQAGLIQDGVGNLYGTAAFGGANGDGMVFKVDTSGNETVLYSFCSIQNCADGAEPVAGLIQDAQGNLYGTTYLGGLYNPYVPGGYGTVFKLGPTGQETVLYNFCPAQGHCPDGANPWAALIQDSAGNLYGTTSGGGTYGVGTVFKVDTAGQEAVLHSFGSGKDGGVPRAGLIQDAAGNLYGTTGGGGAKASGTVFKVAPTGKETVLYSFCSAKKCSDGSFPAAGLF